MKYLLLLPLLFTCFISRSQNFTLSGNIINHEKQAVAAGDVLLISGLDSTSIKKTNLLNGSFNFSSIPGGEYILKITSLGFREKFEKISLNRDLQLEISLQPAAATLQEVTVVGAKQSYSYKNGNVVVNMDNSILSAIPDPMDLLSKLPMVQISPDRESLSIVGKGQPLVYIDNQRMTFEDLKSLPVSDIKTIELLNNPSARYEAEGRAVLLITRRVNKKEGIKGDLSETAAYRKYYLNRAAANISVRKKRLELKSGLQYNELKTWEGNAFEFNIPDHNIVSRYRVTAVTTRKPQFIGNAGAFYQLNDEDYISVSASGRTVKESFPINTESYLKNGTIEENVVTATENVQPNHYYTSNLNYHNKLKSFNGVLFIGLQHTGLTKDLSTRIINRFDGNDPVLSQVRKQDNNINVTAGKIDVEKNFKNGMKLETGGNITKARSNGLSDIENYNPAAKINERFKYQENNYAVYSQLSGKMKKKDYSFGVRMEDTNIRSEYANNGTGSSLHKKSTKLFPRASLVFPLDSSSNVTLRYTKSIVRPNYSNANQTRVYINPNFQFANNINLDPAITQEMSASYQYKNYSVVAALYMAKGPVYDQFEYDEENILLTRSELNYKSETGVSLTLTVPFKYQLWSSSNVMNILYSSIKDDAALVGKSRPIFYLQTSNDFTLPAKFVLNVTAWAATKNYQGVFERRGLYSVDSSLTKTLFKDFTCSLRFNNMFRTINYAERFTINAVSANGEFFDNSRELSLGIKYSFGKLSESRFKNKEIDESGNRVR